MDAYQKGNFKLYKGFDGKYSIKIDDESFRKDIVGKERVFILTGYISHADIYKIESLGIDGKFVNSKGVNGIVREIEGYVRRECK